MQRAGSLGVLRRYRAMRWLGATGFCLSAAQLSLLSFAVAWNGVYLGEVARRCDPGEVGEATAAVLVLTYMGVLVGPALFSLIVWLTGSYSVGFLLPMVTGALAVFCLLNCERSDAAPRAA